MSPLGAAKDLSRVVPPALVARFSAHGRDVKVAAGQVVIASGSDCRDVYLVRSGTMRTALFAATGREVVIRDIVQGELFGELAALDDLPRASTVVAATEAEITVLSQAEFIAAIRDGGDAALWMMRRFSSMIRLYTEKIFELSALPVRSRLHCELLRLAETGVASEAGILITPAPTHADLAARVGSHREMVTREFRYMTEIGALQQSGRRLVITDLSALMREIQRIAGTDGDGLSRHPVLA